MIFQAGNLSALAVRGGRMDVAAWLTAFQHTQMKNPLGAGDPTIPGVLEELQFVHDKMAHYFMHVPSNLWN